MSNSFNPNQQARKQKRVFAGLIVLAAGALLFLKQLDLLIYPLWLFTWPVLLMVLGIANGIKHNFRHPAWLVLVLVGGISLLNRLFFGLHFGVFILPIILIALGIKMLLKKDYGWRYGYVNNHRQCCQQPGNSPAQ